MPRPPLPPASCSSTFLEQCGIKNDAAVDTFQTIQLDPANWKTLYGKAEAQMLSGDYREAWSSCEEAAKLTAKNTCWDRRIQGLMDHVAVQAAAHGCLVGFSGRMIEVHPAGFLEDDTANMQLLTLPSQASDIAAAVDQGSSDTSQVLQCSSGPGLQHPHGTLQGLLSEPVSRAPSASRLKFHRLHRALEAVRDGDIVVLLPGTHYIRSPSLAIRHRIVVCGQKALEDLVQQKEKSDVRPSDSLPVLDHRSNSPLFRVQRSCFIMGLDLDMSGFRECMLVGGDSSCAPVIKDCIVRCSGSDAVNVCEAARARMIRVEMQARKAGLRTFDTSKAELLECRIRGHQGVAAAEKSCVKLTGCEIHDCQAEGVMCVDHARLTLSGCSIVGGAEALLDISGKSSVELLECEVAGTQNGVLVWEQGTCKARCCRIKSGQGYAVFLEQCAPAMKPVCRKELMPLTNFISCKIEGATSPAKLP